MNPTGDYGHIFFSFVLNWVVATQIFFVFTPKIGEDDSLFDFRIFFRWVGEKPPTRNPTQNGNIQVFFS